MLENNEPDYLQDELQKMFHKEEWILIFTPPGKPQWQPIETILGMAKGYVRKQYRHCDQIYGKIGADLIKGFYVDKKTGYRGVTQNAVQKIINDCENNMVNWANKWTQNKITNVVELKSGWDLDQQINRQEEEMQFENGMLIDELFEISNE